MKILNKWTLLGFTFWLLCVFWLAYAGTKITSLTQTAKTGDMVTAAWVNAVNTKLSSIAPTQEWETIMKKKSFWYLWNDPEQGKTEWNKLVNESMGDNYWKDFCLVKNGYTVEAWRLWTTDRVRDCWWHICQWKGYNFPIHFLSHCGEWTVIDWQVLCGKWNFHLTCMR